MKRRSPSTSVVVSGAIGPSPDHTAKGSASSAPVSARTEAGVDRAGALVRRFNSQAHCTGPLRRTPSQRAVPVRRGRGWNAPSSPNARATGTGRAATSSATAETPTHVCQRAMPPDLGLVRAAAQARSPLTASAP